jgi:hypothetical protein
MILFLRNKNNRTIAEAEVYIKTEDGNKFVELHASVDIKYYTEFLLKNLDKAREIAENFNDISELRGWLWETYFAGGDNDVNEYKNVVKVLGEYFSSIAKKYDLYYTED